MVASRLFIYLVMPINGARMTVLSWLKMSVICEVLNASRIIIFTNLHPHNTEHFMIKVYWYYGHPPTWRTTLSSVHSSLFGISNYFHYPKTVCHLQTENICSNQGGSDQLGMWLRWGRQGIGTNFGGGRGRTLGKCQLGRLRRR
jgi:hypothetical protein